MHIYEYLENLICNLVAILQEGKSVESLPVQNSSEGHIIFNTVIAWIKWSSCEINQGETVWSINNAAMSVPVPEDVVWKNPFLERAGFISICKGVESFHTSDWDEINSSTHNYDSLFYKTSKMWSGTQTDQMSAICSICQQPRKKIHLPQSEVIKHTRCKTDSEPLSQNLDQLNATVLVLLAKKIRFFLFFNPS